MLARFAGSITTYNIADAAASGDAVAKEVLNEIGMIIGAGISNYVNILDPGAVVLGGGVMDGLFPYLARGIYKGIEDNVLPEIKPTAIVSSEHINDAPAIGAALLFRPADTWTAVTLPSEPILSARLRAQP
jgi:glucokinase